MNDMYSQKPFSYVDKSGMAPSKQTTLDEDFHSDGTQKSSGNAFDLSRQSLVRASKPKNHDVKKVSTGTVYTRKSETFDKEAPVGDDIKTEPKRGRGRPPGKYGSYKKRIKEALDYHSIESGPDDANAKIKAGLKNKLTADQVKEILQSEEFQAELNELSKKTLASYAKKAGGTSLNSAAFHAMNSGTHSVKGDDKASEKSFHKALGRAKGTMKAIDRLTKEEFQPGDKVEIDGQVGIVEHVIGSNVLVKVNEGIKNFHSTNVKLYEEKETDLTLLEGVDWSRWERSHINSKNVKKSNRGSWMISKHSGGYKYGHKDGEDHITVNGTGEDAAKAGQEWAKKIGAKNVYVLESFTPEKTGNQLELSQLTKAAFAVR